MNYSKTPSVREEEEIKQEEEEKKKMQSKTSKITYVLD